MTCATVLAAMSVGGVGFAGPVPAPALAALFAKGPFATSHIVDSKTPTVRCLGQFETGETAPSASVDWSVGNVRFDRDALGNPYTFFDGDVHQVEKGEKTIDGRRIAYVKYERESNPVLAVRQAGWRVFASMELDLSSLMPERNDYAYVDLESGKIYTLPSIRKTPVGTDPGLVLPASQIPRQIVWQKMSPAEIVDSWYRPYEPRTGNKMPLEGEPWTKMKTADFLPCIDRYGQFKYREWPGKTHSDDELRSAAEEEAKDLAAHPGPDGWNAFGGWAKGPQLKATGRFRTEKVDGKWWLVDPEGRLFWSWGAVRVTPSSAMTPLNGNPRTPKVGADLPDRDCLFEDLPKPGDEYAQFYETFDDLLKPFYLKRGETRWYDFSASNLRRKYGKDWSARYSDICHRRLRSWGANTIANSSDLNICLQDRTPYAERVECLSRPIEGSWGQWFKFRDPFDPSFKPACLGELAKHGREAHDKWCIGFFIDNEIQWGAKDTDLAQWTLWSPDDQPAKVEFVKRLAAKGIDPKNVPAEELRSFTAALVEEYFRRTREAVKEFDADLLYLGCRFAGSARPWVIGPCAKYADVVSYNIYADNLDGWRLPQGLDAPVMVGEFHFGAWDRGPFGCSLRNKGSQAGRAAALKGYVESALGNPQIVGVHWHQFSDQATTGRFDGEYFQVGWTDVCDRPYGETVDALRSIDLYGLRAKTVVARPVPSPALAARLADGPDIIGIVHWGLNTFTDREWGYGNEDPAMLDPSDFSADQIVGACKAGGIGGLVVVAKHHDGFCLWPTKTTEHNITKTPFWRGTGNGEQGTGRDYVKEMEQACRKAGVKFGVYCSPWDRNNAAYATSDYVKTYHAQVEELNDGRYGEIFEMWFDGANGGDGYYGGAWEKRSIGKAREYYQFEKLWDRVEELQPNVCFFGGRNGFTWPGNESGVVPPESGGTRDDGTFKIYEADFPLRPGWFYHKSQDGYSRSGEFLMKVYLRTVGNGATMDIGIAPDQRGRLTDEDAACLRRFSEIRREFFSKPVADASSPFNVIVMKEDFRRGERVDEWRVVLDGRELAKGGKIGTKRIRVLDAPVCGKDLKLEIVKGDAKADEIKMELFAADEELVRKVMSSVEPKRPPSPFERKGVLTSRTADTLVFMMKNAKETSSILLTPDPGALDGTPVAFRLAFSVDGADWQEDGAEYRLDNVAANPIPQAVDLGRKAKVKYLRLKAVRTLNENADVHLKGLDFVDKDVNP